MVCIPCFIVPVLLIIWKKFIQPYFLKYIWNPWEKKDAQGNIISTAPDNPFDCKDGVCPFVPSKKAVATTTDDAKDGDKDRPGTKEKLNVIAGGGDGNDKKND